MRELLTSTVIEASGMAPFFFQVKLKALDLSWASEMLEINKGGREKRRERDRRKRGGESALSTSMGIEAIGMAVQLECQTLEGLIEEGGRERAIDIHGYRSNCNWNARYQQRRGREKEGGREETEIGVGREGRESYRHQTIGMAMFYFQVELKALDLSFALEMLEINK